MSPAEIKTYKKDIDTQIENHSIFDAIKNLRILADNQSFTKYLDVIDNIEMQYKYMLQYLSEGTDDPQQDNVYNKILLSLHSLNYNITRKLLLPIDASMYNSSLRLITVGKRNLATLIDEYKNSTERLEILTLVPVENQDSQKIIDTKKEIESIESLIFKYIWTSEADCREEAGVIANIFKDNSLKSYFKEYVLNALMLNLLECFDEAKINIVIDVYENLDEVDCKVKSIVILTILLLKYNNQFILSTLLQNRLALLNDNEEFNKDIKNIFLEIIRTKDTERITKKMNDELLPELMKISPKIYNKIKGNDTLLIDDDFAGNPDWENLLDNSGISKKIQELNEMQLEGGDVFMSTFSHLKQFPFFNNISNWFVPFHENHSIVSCSFNSDSLKSIIINSQFLCNNDKFSFALAIASVPDAQKQMMANQIQSQNIELKEMSTAELASDDKLKRNKILRFVQDLYRFFMLYPRKNEFYNPFVNNLKTANNQIINIVKKDVDFIQLIGEFYFKRELYDDALEIFSLLPEYAKEKTDYYQKMGFCYQNLADYKNALDFYDKADIIVSDNLWTLQHIAICHKALNNYEYAIKYYSRASAIAPQNASILLNLGHLYLSNNDIDEALKNYYEVEYLSPGKALRPIAWCEFINGNYQQSKNYYNKIIQNKPTAHDYLNEGHLLLCNRDVKGALDSYLKGIEIIDGGYSEFIKLLNNDTQTLVSKEIPIKTIEMISDMLKYKLN